MTTSRRSFLKSLSALVGTTQLAGCLGDGGTSSAEVSPASTSNPPSGASAPTAQQAPVPQAPAPAPAPATPAPSAPTQTTQNSGPVWQTSPTIEFVEGVPAVVSVRDFVRDPDSDPLVITLQAGALIPGLTWNPNNATINYDGRPLGARDTAPVLVGGIVFSADDRR